LNPPSHGCGPIVRTIVATGIAIPLLARTAASAVTFTDSGAPLIGISYAAAAWCDDDNDGDLDLLMTGLGATGHRTQLYRNSGGVLSELPTSLPHLSHAALAWGDYDSDDDADVLLMGTGASGRTTVLHRNDGGGQFTNIPLSLPGLDDGAIAWGDFDNDGDPDIAVSGHDAVSGVSRIYRNMGGGSFVDIGAGLAAVFNSSLAWGDYDKDGDLDLVLTGYTGSTAVTRLYRNNAGLNFTSVSVSFIGLYLSSVAWGDFDNDGDLDLALAGIDASFLRVARIYRNMGSGTFVDIVAGLPGVSSSALAWGDYDNDGDLDLVLSGLDASLAAVTRVYQQNAGVFANAGFSFSSVYRSAVAWGDIDVDGDLDIAISGWNGTSDVAKVYRSDGAAANLPPSAPIPTTAVRTGSDVTFSWTAAADDHTPTLGLGFNLRIGTTPGGDDIVAAMAESTGRRRVTRLGNAQLRTSWTVRQLPGQTYYWSVQSLDTAFQGSPFGAEKVFDFSLGVTANTFPGALAASAACGDSDGDGDLDFLLTGHDGANPRTSLLRNISPSVFGVVSLGLPGVYFSSVAWGDFDGDADLDLLISGHNGTAGLTRIYRNDGNDVFADIAAGLPGVFESSVAWGDDDNDGDLDILLSGVAAAGPIARVYRNMGGTFVDGEVGLAGRSQGMVSWEDYDRDGDLDILIAGIDTASVRRTSLHRNDGGGSYTEVGTSLPGISDGMATWADYDVDGYPDLLLVGQGDSSPTARLFHNDTNGSLDYVVTILAGVRYAAVAWGDYDNDGDPDLALTGFTGAANLARLYRNERNGVFAESGSMTGVSRGSVVWGDGDDDGDLDLLIAGQPGPARYYLNTFLTPNVDPGAPVSLGTSRVGNQVTMRWLPGTDDHTPTGELGYNMRIGTTPGGQQIMSAMSNTATGKRRLVGKGNCGVGGEWTMRLPVGTYWWSVQAIDGAFRGSPFSEERILDPTSAAESPGAPDAIMLERGSPSPFHSSTLIRYAIPRATSVNLSIFDTSGRLVRVLEQGYREAGRQAVPWDGRNEFGQSLPSGIYFVRLHAGEVEQVQKLVRSER